ncbi:tail fiber domain-containing protein [uncultured Roseivirga sp.]|uniref:tail fiber domain-containing protein n=1 Tax=uncultured Roseivirga sp. TaxID=543088 RepID=UPI00258B608E|nr:tail fiber domain-containing protein [uncultured Roseivirga sp.]
MRAFLYRLSIALSILSCSFAYSQSVGIGDEKFTPHPSALLELKSGAKGLLIPRVTESDRQAIDNPAEGLLIYQTDGSAGFYLYSASRWSLLITESNLPVDDNQQLSFNLTNYRLTLENGGEVDLSILRNGRSLIETIDNGDGTFTFKYNDGTSFTTRNLQGPQGLKGDKGTDGINGVDGADGQDGNTILSGNTDPNNTQGKDGDIYINTATNTYFGPKTAGVWGAGTSLIGPAGADGADGTNGIDGTNGVDGQDGNTILSGNTDPMNTQGKDGDIYINTATNTYFGPKTTGVWGAGTSLIGPAGADGADGTNGINGTNGVDGQDGNTILSGNTDPINAQGKDGDIYINTATNTYFGPKTAGAWGAGTSLIGPAGADGADGTNGIDGTNGVDGQDGNTILSGNTDPNNTQGKDGDIYINTATNTYFGPKTAGVWGTGTSLVGPAGADGADGADGTNGIDGTNGVDGQDGNTILSGNTDPNNTQGKDGDIYINTATNTYFGPKTAGAWGAGTSLIGPAGADGADGTDGTNGIDGTNGADGQDGNTVLSGSSNPTNATGNTGDFYYNFNTFTFFGPKTGTGWPAGVVLKGTGISSTLDNPDGSLTFNFTDGTSFTSQPDGDFSDTNELITSLSLSGSSLQIREGGVNRSVDLSSIGTSSEITDTDNNTLITVDNSGANDDIIRFSIQGNETMRLRNRTLELLANSGSTFIGESAGISSSGAGNVGLGSETMLNNSSGRFNVAVGYRALRQNATGQGNVAIGYNAGFNETGSNKLYIANSNTNTPLIWGDFQAGVANINGKLGVGVANPAAMTNELEVNGHATVITLTETSDQRFKKNILPLENSLSKLLSLRGVSYQWRIDDFPNRRFKEGSNIGLIAQEVQQLFPELVSTNSEGFLSVSYSGLSPIIIEAMKEQQKLIEDLQSELKEADNRYKALLERISSIEQALKKQDR